MAAKNHHPRTITYGSLCSGIEAASVAWQPLGWQAAFFSETAAFPCALLAYRWPSVHNLGDMRYVAAGMARGEVCTPDIITGGTPCQAFSVAGTRGGLSDERGQLTLAFAQIADTCDAVRQERGLPPSIIIWENVPGVFSDKTNAFGCFLAALAGEVSPLQPAGEKWSYAGAVSGPSRDVAWRVLSLKREIGRRWTDLELIDMLKEVDLREKFSSLFRTSGSREVIAPETLQHRLLLCLFGLGTSVGLKRIASQQPGVSYEELRHIKRKFIQKDTLRSAIVQIVNGIFRIKQPTIWGNATTSCAADSRKFSAYDQNLMTEWHARYGGRGIMIYWHVDTNSTCIYSQLRRCSSSEVAAMMEGVLRHCTDMEINHQYVDSHGQSEVAFAFSYVLGFDLLPRLKNIARQKLSICESGDIALYPALSPVLTKEINWELIRQQYDEIIKYTAALRTGTAEPEAILRRFTRNNAQHPTYKALAELGRAVKTIFLCRYLNDEGLRCEINSGLNVVENWNSANDFIFYGEHGEFTSNRPEEQEISMLALHLLQISLVYVNTLLIQEVLSEPAWRSKMTEADWRGLSPLIYNHVNPYGRIELDMSSRLKVAA